MLGIEIIANIEDGKMIHYLNINDVFLNNRRMRQDLFPDHTHPNEKGYAVWAAAIEPTIAKLMGEQ